MKTAEQYDHTEAVKQFSQGLPDARTSYQSTILQDFLIDDETITFSAQKAKGSTGMTWRISAVHSLSNRVN